VEASEKEMKASKGKNVMSMVNGADLHCMNQIGVFSVVGISAVS
jgi:hypothetical protein